MIERNIVLASASPRRQQLLAQIGIVPAEVMQANIDETPWPEELPADCVTRLALAKAREISALRPNSIVLAADTIIACDGQIVGKPVSREHAFSLWSMLSNRTHQVLTCVAMIHNGKSNSLLNTNEVTFAEISVNSMAAYWASGEPCDKAGAYAIQGAAAVWISDMRGSYSGIMGLPLHETALLLKRAGIKTLL